ncbi:MAG: hypothetical protein H0X62_05150, partial [Bacteroidetes bacterium]|nr:hypothetical protein [Bacteroidota bacterium]
MSLLKNYHSFFFLAFFLTAFSAGAQNYTKYWVFFSDKPLEDFNPYEYFDEKAIERRIKHELPLNDYTDLPVNESYVRQITQIADSVGFVTRWFNGMIFYGNQLQFQEIKNLAFVSKAFEASKGNSYLASFSKGKDDGYKQLSPDKKELLANQLLSLGYEEFEKNNIDGKGIRIAVFDAGFPGVDTNPVFEHIRKENRIIKTYDFVRKKEQVYAANKHGTM